MPFCCEFSAKSRSCFPVVPFDFREVSQTQPRGNPVGLFLAAKTKQYFSSNGTDQGDAISITLPTDALRLLPKEAA